jgi:uncharacterized Zn-binding protein involved in type VI secretion
VSIVKASWLSKATDGASQPPSAPQGASSPTVGFQQSRDAILRALEPEGKSDTKDVMMGEASNLIAFIDAPKEGQGKLEYVTQLAGGVMGIVNAGSTLLDTGFAMVTADIAAMMPSLPAAVIGAVLHVGTPFHAHAHPPSLIPPAAPVPLPSIGNILMAGSINVLINGVPAARAGDIGIALTCCSLAPPTEIITGSSSVWIGGSRAARLFDLTRHDNPTPVGLFAKAMMAAGTAMGVLGTVKEFMDASAAAEKAEKAQENTPGAEAEAAAAEAEGKALSATMSAAQTAADAAAMALELLIGKDPGIGPGVGVLMGGSPNVLIGGIPVPNLMECLKGLMKAAKGLGKNKDRRRDQDGESASFAGCVECAKKKGKK